jgi:NodT family efflux transporter outer membrane factor (OMF) lipoprotein
VASAPLRLLRLGLPLLLSLAGCSLVPAYVRPDPPLPASWNQGDLRDAGTVRGAWWRDFGDPQLSSLIERSLAGNQNLQAAMARIEQARGQVEIGSAALYPSVGLTGTLDRQSARGNSLRRQQTQNLFAQASYEIDFWGKNRAAAASSWALADAAAEDRDTVAVSLAASVANIYFQVLSLRERMRLAQDIAASGRRTLTLIEAQAREGTTSTLQVEQQRNTIAAFDAAVPALGLQLDWATHLLATLVGVAPQGFDVTGQGLDGIRLPQVSPDLPATVLRQRPDVAGAEARLVSANFNVGVARAAFYPSLSLSAALGVGTGSLSTLHPMALLTQILATPLQTLIDNGRLSGQLRYDRARVTELTATYRQTVIVALQDVEDQLSAIARLDQQGVPNGVAVESARRAATLANAQYRLGAADFLTVLTVERTLYQTEDAGLQLHLLRLQAAIGLNRAVGGGFGTPVRLTALPSPLAAN